MYAFKKKTMGISVCLLCMSVVCCRDHVCEIVRVVPKLMALPGTLCESYL